METDVLSENTNKEEDTVFFQNLKKYFSIKNKQEAEIFIKRNGGEEIIYHFCHAEGNHIILNYIYFKYITKHNMASYDAVTNYLINIMKDVLKKHDQFVIHLNIRYLILMDIDKYFSFIKQISQLMKDTFPEKLKSCYIYNAPFVFSKLFSIISVFIDKNTQQKIKMMETE